MFWQNFDHLFWQNCHKNTKINFWAQKCSETEKLKKTKPAWNQILQYWMCWIHAWNFFDRDTTKFRFSSFSTISNFCPKTKLSPCDVNQKSRRMCFRWEDCGIVLTKHCLVSPTFECQPSHRGPESSFSSHSDVL